MSYRVRLRKRRRVPSRYGAEKYVARDGRIILRTPWRAERARAVRDGVIACNRRFGLGTAEQGEDRDGEPAVRFLDPIVGGRYIAEVQFEAIPAEQPELPL